VRGARVLATFGNDVGQDQRWPADRPIRVGPPEWRERPREHLDRRVSDDARIERDPVERDRNAAFVRLAKAVQLDGEIVGRKIERCRLGRETGQLLRESRAEGLGTTLARTLCIGGWERRFLEILESDLQANFRRRVEYCRHGLELRDSNDRPRLDYR